MSKRHFDIQKVIIILGQTATGKSALAIKIAKKVNGEVISADSRQIYKGLDIGTGKISKREMKGIPHHLLDVANPKHKFSVAEFQQLAISAIAEIISRGKTPIICGGTGFYIDAITKGIVFPEVPPNYPLRKKLAFASDRALMLKLQKLDPERAKNIDPKNKHRLIRAIEIAKTLGKVPKIKVKTLPYKFMKIGLYLPPEKLKKKVCNTPSDKRRGLNAIRKSSGLNYIFNANWQLSKSSIKTKISKFPSYLGMRSNDWNQTLKKQRPARRL